MSTPPERPSQLPPNNSLPAKAIHRPGSLREAGEALPGCRATSSGSPQGLTGQEAAQVDPLAGGPENTGEPEAWSRGSAKVHREVSGHWA